MPKTVLDAVDELDELIDEMSDTWTKTESTDLPTPTCQIPHSTHCKQWKSYSCDFGSPLPVQAFMKDHVDVFWQIDNKFYAGKVSFITNDGMCVVSNDN